MTYNYATFAVKNFVFVDLRIKAFLTKLSFIDGLKTSAIWSVMY